MNEPKHIILAGFMGTGKSSVGRQLALKLGRPFVDTDVVLENRRGQTVAQIFATAGEAFFRQLEAELCRELAGWPPHVIATGGGMLLPAANLEAVSAGNLVICLDASPATLWPRLAGRPHRPLLNRPDGQAVMTALWMERQPAYQRIPKHIETAGLTVTQVANEILARWWPVVSHIPHTP